MLGVNTAVLHRKGQLFLLCCLHGLGRGRAVPVCLLNTMTAETTFLGQKLLGMVMLAALEEQPAVQLLHKVATPLGNDRQGKSLKLSYRIQEFSVWLDIEDSC